MLTSELYEHIKTNAKKNNYGSTPLTMKRITFINRNNVFVKLNNGHV